MNELETILMVTAVVMVFMVVMFIIVKYRDYLDEVDKIKRAEDYLKAKADEPKYRRKLYNYEQKIKKDVKKAMEQIKG